MIEQCDHEDIKILDSRPEAKFTKTIPGSLRRRRWICQQCGLKVGTVEVDADQYLRLLAVTGEVAQGVAEIQRLAAGLANLTTGEVVGAAHG